MAVGLDIGGTKIAGGIVAFPSAEIVARSYRKTVCTRDPEYILSDALDMVRELAEAANRWELHIKGIGLGVPELVNPEGEVTSSYNFDWRGKPLKEIFSRFGPTFLDADVRAAALAEARFGTGRAYRIFAYVTVGTGIGSCLVLDAVPYKGARGSALTLSSSPLSTICDRCGAVLHPILDRYASGPALAERYNRSSDHPVADGEAVVAAAEAGEATAIEIVRSAGRALGVSVAFLVNVLDPEAVVVGGGLGLAGGLYWNEFIDSTREHIWSETNRYLPIVPAALGIDAGLIGAAALVEPAIDA